MTPCGFLLDLKDEPVSLQPGERLSFGRDKKNDYPIEDPLLSRKHAVLAVSQDGTVTLEDLGSVNHTFVNEQSIEPNTPTEIDDGDLIRMGSLIITFRTRIDDAEAGDSGFENMATLQLNPSLADAVSEKLNAKAGMPAAISSHSSEEDLASKYPDQIKITEDAGAKIMTAAEWVAIPDQERADILLNSKVEFMCAGRVLSTKEALDMLRKGPPS